MSQYLSGPAVNCSNFHALYLFLFFFLLLCLLTSCFSFFLLFCLPVNTFFFSSVVTVWRPLHFSKGKGNAALWKLDNGKKKLYFRPSLHLFHRASILLKSWARHQLMSWVCFSFDFN